MVYPRASESAALSVRHGYPSGLLDWQLPNAGVLVGHVGGKAQGGARPGTLRPEGGGRGRAAMPREASEPGLCQRRIAVSPRPSHCSINKRVQLLWPRSSGEQGGRGDTRDPLLTFPHAWQGYGNSVLLAGVLVN